MPTSAPPAPPSDAPWLPPDRRLRTPSTAVAVACARWSLDVASRALSGDEVLGRFLGLPPGQVEAVGSAAWLSLVHPVDVLRVVAAVEATVGTGAPFHVLYRVRVRGRERTLFARAALERDQDGLARRIVGEMRELR